MASWVVTCPECAYTFTHTRIEASLIEQALRDPRYVRGEPGSVPRRSRPESKGRHPAGGLNRVRGSEVDLLLQEGLGQGLNMLKFIGSPNLEYKHLTAKVQAAA